MDCTEVRLKITEMFVLLTPYEINLVRSEIDFHLMRCEECRLYLIQMYCRKKEEIRS